MHPLIVISMGGISQTTNAIKDSFSSLDSGDNAFKGLTFKTPDPIVLIRNDLVTIVNYENELTNPFAIDYIKYILNSHLHYRN